MTTLTWALLSLTIAVAALDWFAVGTGRLKLEYLAKPLTMIPLIAAALVLDPVNETARWAFVVALAISLAGDIFLMLPDDERWFVPGLGAFLLGHLAYVVGLFAAGWSAEWLAIGGVLAVVLAGSVGVRIVRAASAADAQMGIPVGIYIAVISLMFAAAVGSAVPIAVAGAAIFCVSDACLGWARFVRDFAGSRLAIITTYHVAQIVLVVSLTSVRG